MMGADGATVGIWGIVVAVASGIGAASRAAWVVIREALKERRQTSEQKDATKASFISLAQSQMNDLNEALFRQIADMQRQLDAQSQKIDAQAQEIDGLRARVRELER